MDLFDFDQTSVLIKKNSGVVKYKWIYVECNQGLKVNERKLKVRLKKYK